MKYYMIAGERSGDLHASNLIKQLARLDQHANIRGLGGELMQSAGAALFCNYSSISYMGFLEVFRNIFQIMKVMKSVKKDILTFQPDAMVLVDFAGFNMKIAAFAKKHNIKVCYYISPKIWAWNQKRALKIKRTVDKMFVILPFEIDFYKKYDFKVDYVGNPVNDSILNFEPDPLIQDKIKTGSRPMIALLPGSRKQEVENMLKVLDQMPDEFPDYDFAIAGVSNLDFSIYKGMQKTGSLKLIVDQTYDLLSVSTVAIVTSGTATLETALMGIPQVVVYKTSPVSYKIAKMLIKVKFISLVNLIAGKEIVKELIQDDFSKDKIVAAVKELLESPEAREKQLAEYRKIKNILGSNNAAMKTAELITNYLRA